MLIVGVEKWTLYIWRAIFMPVNLCYSNGPKVVFFMMKLQVNFWAEISLSFISIHFSTPTMSTFYPGSTKPGDKRIKVFAILVAIITCKKIFDIESILLWFPIFAPINCIPLAGKRKIVSPRFGPETVYTTPSHFTDCYL